LLKNYKNAFVRLHTPFTPTKRLTFNFNNAMKKIAFLSLICLFIGCKGDAVLSKECGGKDPINNLPWLNDIVKNAAKGPCFSVSQSTIGKTVVFGVVRCGCCFAIDRGTLYRCDGSLYCNNLTNQKCNEASAEFQKNAQVLYQESR
jgi:hypothetical protein